MRAGRLDYETGKWVEDPPAAVAPPAAAAPPSPVAPVMPASAAPPPPVPQSAADKARFLLQQRQGRP